MTPQARQIMKHLEQTGSISNVEAQAIYKCRALPRRISDIEQYLDAYDASRHYIERQRKTDATGQRYVRYYLKSF